MVNYPYKRVFQKQDVVLSSETDQEGYTRNEDESFFVWKFKRNDPITDKISKGRDSLEETIICDLLSVMLLSILQIKGYVIRLCSQIKT